ncbi:hypothetical protein [Bacillus cereus]|uniref:hypothetical protein n=1 Tax=Bacillus cereus TaxID=1396 RepID=UPI001596A1D1|nr:hypothetical protein [Bacillus cereus]
MPTIPDEYDYYYTTNSKSCTFMCRRGYTFVEGSGDKFLKSMNHLEVFVEVIYKDESPISFYLQKENEKYEIEILSLNGMRSGEIESIWRELAQMDLTNV